MLASNLLKEWKTRLIQYVLPSSSIDIEDSNIKFSTSLVKEIFRPGQKGSLSTWLRLYLEIETLGAPIKTQQAKRRDLDQFARFFVSITGNDDLNTWTPAITKHFQETMVKTISAVTDKPYSPTTVNRIMASLRHFGRWLQKQSLFLTSDPFKGIKDSRIEESAWNGLTEEQLISLKMACEERIKHCRKNNQNPYLETAVFYLLFQTGLRESELVTLNVGQYRNQGLCQVLRHKNKRITPKVPVPKEAREYIEQYLRMRDTISENEPLFLSRYGTRLAAQDVRRICQRLVKQATCLQKTGEKFRFTPHMLRHTFLRKVTNAYGVHFAQQMSGNVSIREIFRYAKPSQQDVENIIEQLFL